MRDWSLFLEVDPLLLTPLLMRPAVRLGLRRAGSSRRRGPLPSAIYSNGMNFLGLPAGVVPPASSTGRPAGVQVIGARYREDLVLDALEAIEARAGFLVERLWGLPGPPDLPGRAGRNLTTSEDGRNRPGSRAET